MHAAMHKSGPPDPVGPAASARPSSPHQPAAPARPASSAAHPAAAEGAVDLLSLRGPDYQAAVRQLLQPLTAAHQTPAPEVRTSQQDRGCEGSDALKHQQTSEESGDGQAQGGTGGAGTGGGQEGWGGGHQAARPLQELLQQHAGLGLLGAALRRAGLLEGPALTAQQYAEVRDWDVTGECDGAACCLLWLKVSRSGLAGPSTSLPSQIPPYLGQLRARSWCLCLQGSAPYVLFSCTSTSTPGSSSLLSDRALDIAWVSLPCR